MHVYYEMAPEGSGWQIHERASWNESWRPVVGYEGEYEVSDAGSVKSLPRILGDGRRWPGKLMSPSAHGKRGYLAVPLARDGRRKVVTVHRLVLEAFRGAPGPGQVARHLNDIPTDNRLENLAWGTFSENVADAKRNGGHKSTKPLLCPLGHGLEGDNLAKSYLDRGVRTCLACIRARASCRKRGVPFSEEVAHDRYARILRYGRDSYRKTCHRGHLRLAPNLRGSGECKACSRERDNSRYHNRPFNNEYADQAYREIMKERPAS